MPEDLVHFTPVVHMLRVAFAQNYDHPNDSHYIEIGDNQAAGLGGLTISI
mgnify:CR=1 FL=1